MVEITKMVAVGIIIVIIVIIIFSVIASEPYANPVDADTGKFLTQNEIVRHQVLTAEPPIGAKTDYGDRREDRRKTISNSETVRQNIIHSKPAHGKGSGVPFEDENGSSYTCPASWRRTGYPVDSEKACAKTLLGPYMSAKKVGTWRDHIQHNVNQDATSVSGPLRQGIIDAVPPTNSPSASRSFKGVGGDIYECPVGYERSAYDERDPRACMKGRLVAPVRILGRK